MFSKESKNTYLPCIACSLDLLSLTHCYHPPSAIRLFFSISLKILVLKSNFFPWISRWNFQFKGSLAIKTFQNVFFHLLSQPRFSLLSAMVVWSSLLQPSQKESTERYFFIFSPSFWSISSFLSFLLFFLLRGYVSSVHLPVSFPMKDTQFKLS